jgi:hypothetical protein
LSLLKRRFIRGNIHPSIDLPGVRGEDLCVKRPRDIDGDIAFSDGGRTNQYDERSPRKDLIGQWSHEVMVEDEPRSG